MILIHCSIAQFSNKPPSGVIKFIYNISTLLTIVNGYDTHPADELRLVHYQLTKALPDQKLEREKIGGLGMVCVMASLRLGEVIKCHSLRQVFTL